MAVELHIDIETFSSVDIASCGSYKYFESPDFEILMIAYSFKIGGYPEEVKIIDLAQGDELPWKFQKALLDPTVEKHAHNANFERNAFKAYGYDIPAEQWHCSAVKAGYCGLPMSLDGATKALKMGDQGKNAEGKALIRYFSCLVKPTKTNGGRYRNLPKHDSEKWERYKEYCRQDVAAEMGLLDRLKQFEIPEKERRVYILDQEINDRGVNVDVQMAQNAIIIDNTFKDEVTEKLKNLTGLVNPNSVAQLKKWLSEEMQTEITTLAKDNVQALIKEHESGAAVEYKPIKFKGTAPDLDSYQEMRAFLKLNGYIQSWHEDNWVQKGETNPQAGTGTQSLCEILIERAKPKKAIPNIGNVVEVLKLRELGSKTSTKKFEAMVNYAMRDSTAHGLLYFYGANRTGRWAGRAVQLQNLPRNKMKLLDFARNAVRDGDYELLTMMFDNIPKVLSELIRTALIPSEGNVFAVADYSAIEGRITAWLADEKWRLDVFAGDGKIYEASAAMMFNVPVESIGKGSEYRDKGKIAELALGFGGSVGALKTMGGEAMGLSEQEMTNIVARWRKASPKIVEMWYEFERKAISAIKIGKPLKSLKGIVFNYEHKCLTIQLPSGRKLIYQNAMLSTNRWGSESIKYMGMNQETKQWGWTDTYGGKLSENIIQAIARDLLAEGMLRIDKAGFDIVMHVHDEVVCDIPDLSTDFVLSELCRILGEPVDWAPGLGTPAEGFVTPYYKKD